MYIFDAKNIMEYTLRLDDYTIMTDKQLEIYETNLPNVQAKYCVNRVIQAINNQDYEYIYNKLDVVQKSNYYSNIEDFKQFIQKDFWEENDYEIIKTYMISNNVYQFTVKLTNKNIKMAYRLYTAAVTLKKDDDFEIALKKN